MSYKPDITLARWGETVGGIAAANRAQPPSGLRDTGHLSNDVLPSTFYNELHARHYEWEKYVNGLDAVSVKYYGAIGDGVANDTTAFQNAVADAAAKGKRIIIPRGQYIITATIPITTRSTVLVGEFADRANVSGTQICYTGTGSCFEIGTDNGQPWDASNYDGPQGHYFEGFRLTHTATDTSVGLSGLGASATYKAGSYGIRDWRGGGIGLHRMGIEGFENNFWGIQSDLNVFYDVKNLYSLNGIYLGPRSDQFTGYSVESFFCRRAWTIDRATGCSIVDPKVMFSGTATTCPIEIRKGSSSVHVIRPWFENADASYVGEIQGFVSAGMVDGYGPGGVGTTTTSANNIDVDQALFYTTNSGNGHVRCIVALGAATAVRVRAPAPRTPNTFSSLSAIMESPAGTAYTDTQSVGSVEEVTASLSSGAVYANNGTGNPAVTARHDGPQCVQTSPRHIFRRHGATPNGGDEFFIGTEGTAGRFVVHQPNYTNSGQKNRLNLLRSLQHASAEPSSGNWERGDFVLNDVIQGFNTPMLGWVCVTAGIAGSTAVFAPVHRLGFNTGAILKVAPGYQVGGNDRLLVATGGITGVFTLDTGGSLYDGQAIDFCNNSSVGWTFAAGGGATLVGTTTLVVTGGARWVYSLGSTTWYRTA